MNANEISRIAEEVSASCKAVRNEIIRIDEMEPNSIIAGKVASAQKALDKVSRFCDDIIDETNKVLFDAKVKEMLKTKEGRDKLSTILDGDDE